jgi:hypothetical protein
MVRSSLRMKRSTSANVVIGSLSRALLMMVSSPGRIQNPQIVVNIRPILTILDTEDNVRGLVSAINCP